MDPSLASPNTAVQTSDLKASYHRDGYVGPFTAFGSEELARLNFVSLVESFEKERGWARNRHLDVPAIAEICRCERVIAPLCAVLGQELILWRSNIFAVSSRSDGFSWHQDDYRTLLSCPPGAAHCSVQINFTASTSTNCVAIVPQSHGWDVDDLVRRGYSMVPGTDGGAYGTPEWELPATATVKDMPLEAGQFYVFHSRMLHASVRARNRRAGAPFSARNVANWFSSASASLRPETIRYSIALRIATPDTQVLPGAYEETPTRAAAVLLSGDHVGGVNRLGTWAS